MTTIALPERKIILPPLDFPRWLRFPRGMSDERVARMFAGAFRKPFQNAFANADAATVTTLIYDTFTDTNGTNLNSHTIAPTNTPSTAYTVSVGTCTIQNNKAQSTQSLWVCDAGQTNVTVSATVTTGNSGRGNVGIVTRYQDSTHYWMAYVDNGSNEFILYERNGGFTARSSVSLTIADTTAYVVKIISTATNVSATLDGSNTVSYNSTLFANQTKVGGYSDFAPTVSSQTWDDFLVTA